MEKRFPILIADDKLNVGFVDITLFRWERMADVLVRNHHLSDYSITRIDGKGAAIERCDKLFAAHSRRLPANGEDIDPQLVISQKFGDLVKLLRPFVKERDGGV